MSDICDSESDSDVSSNSSWTVLEEAALKASTAVDSNNNTHDGSQKENEDNDDNTFTLSTTDFFADVNNLEYGNKNEEKRIKENEINELIHCQSASSVRDLNCESEEDLSKASIEQNCPTLEDYLKTKESNRETIGFDEIPKEKQKSDRRKRKKSNPQTFGSLAIIGTVIALAGVSFICLLTPNNYNLSSSEIDKLKTECVPEKVLKNCNETLPTIPVLATNKDNKLALVDKDSIINRCFKKNLVAPQRARKYLKSTKQFKSVKTLNLLNDKGNVNGEKIFGPIRYEEFRKQNKKYLNTISKREKHQARNVFKKPSTPTLLKNDLQVHMENFNSTTQIPARNNNTASTFSRTNDSNSSSVGLISDMSKTSQSTPQIIKVKKPITVIQSPIADNRKKENIDFFRKANTPVPPCTFQNRTKKVETPNNLNQTEESSSFDYSTHGKIMCNVLQDVLLLKMTSRLARRFNQKKEASQKMRRKDLRLKKENRSATDMSFHKSPPPPRTKPTLRETHAQIRKPGMKSDTTLNLLDELPFSKRNDLKIEIQKRGENFLKRINYLKSIYYHNNNDTHEPVDSSCERLSKDVDNLKKKQTEFLERLKSHQKERLEFLKKVKERQQESIKNLIKGRQRSGLSTKDASCGRYHVPIPNPKEINKELEELEQKRDNCCDNTFCIAKTTSECLSECNIPLLGYPQLKSKRTKRITHAEKINKNGKISKMLDESSAKNPCYQKQNVKLLENNDKNVTKVLFKIPRDYMEMKRKYYESIGNYWAKREEYLNKRIQCMTDMSESIKDIVELQKGNRMKKMDDKKEKAIAIDKPCFSQPVMNVINEALSVFPDDAGIRDLKSQIMLANEEEASLQSDLSCSSCDDDCKTDDVFEFTGTRSQCALGKNYLYNSMFGRQGQNIKKRDMAVWYCNRFVKRRKFFKDFSRHDMYRLNNNNKKAKKEHLLA